MTGRSADDGQADLVVQRGRTVPVSCRVVDEAFPVASPSVIAGPIVRDLADPIEEGVGEAVRDVLRVLIVPERDLFWVGPA